jgi:apolipoprotein N-acyltransferase
MTLLPRPFGALPGRPALATNLAMLAGLLVTAGLPPFPWTGVLVPVGIGLLAVQLVRAETPGRTSWAFGLVHQASLLSWMFMLVPAKSIPHWSLKYIQAVATIAYVAAFYALLGWAFGRLRRRLGADGSLLLLPVLWVAMEALRSRGEMAFGWCLAGAAVIGTPLQGAAAAWLVLIAGGSLLKLEGPDPAVEGGRLRTAPLLVTAVQADVDLGDKWDKTRIDSTKIPYETLSIAAAGRGAELLVWAETAVPAYVRHDAGMLQWVRGVVRRAGVPLYTGFPDARRAPDGSVETFNSSGLFAADGMLQGRYAKHHLLPIGEAMPFTRWLPFLKKVDLGQAEWTPGPPPEPLVVATPEGAFPFSGLICFESILAPLARQSVRQGSRCLMIITNDGWFGRSAGPLQHAAMARVRAAECAVPVVRSANNGISLVCDDRGRLQGSLGLGRRGVVTAAVTAGRADTLYLRAGAWPLAVAMLLWTVFVVRRGAGPRRRPR